jgi:tyrosyl-tRNA synthetase
MNFIKELQWRGMIHDIMPETEKRLSQGMATGYVGYDPTAPSLHLGHLVPIMMQVHFQRAGHKPIALVGGATGMIGDPSGRSEERQLLDIEVIRYNEEKIKEQLNKFLDFESGKNAAIMENNYNWFEDFRYLNFLRDVGKHITINYMLAKDSVKMRLDKGLSFTEFSYQLLQAYDFYHLYQKYDCIIQMGGSDQWGNITAGTELIRRKASGEAFALTCPLITRTDGTKFGKSEGENVWLSAEFTSPYKFYQYWMNCSDKDAENFIKIFTLLSKEEISSLIAEHRKAPHLRILQKKIAREVTTRVHSETDYKSAVEASEILFGGGTTEQLKKLSETDLIQIFEGVPMFNTNIDDLSGDKDVLDLLGEEWKVFPSKGEVRRLIQSGGLSINKVRINDTAYLLSKKDLLNGKFILVQKGKKNYFLIKAE